MKRMIAILFAISMLFAPLAASAQQFDPSIFHFVTKIPDDGEGEGGGYQEAQTTLRIVDTRYMIPPIYACPVVVGMGIRTKKDGVVTPARAARISAAVATRASKVVHQRDVWVKELLCSTIIKGMEDIFNADFGTLGARVHKPRP